MRRPEHLVVPGEEGSEGGAKGEALTKLITACALIMQLAA